MDGLDEGGWLERYRVHLSLVLLLLLVAGIVLLLERRPQATPLAIVTPAANVAASMKVYVTGAVTAPGVYTLPGGLRVEDALNAAGGPTADADLTRINLAVKLRDEQQITVPAVRNRGAGGEGPAQPTGPGKVDINSASQKELEALPSIGPVTAEKIISYRQANGPFQSVEKLVEAKLVSASTFQKILDLVIALY